MPWKYLNFFLDDDQKLAAIGREYAAGRMFTGDVKKELIQVLAVVSGHSILELMANCHWTRVRSGLHV